MAKANAQQAVQRAQQLIKQGQFRSASKITAQLVVAIPSNTQLLLMHASTLERRGRYLQAIECMQRAISLMGDHAKERTQVILSIVKSYTLLGQIDHAISILQTEIDQINDSNSQSHQILAASLIDRFIDTSDHAKAQSLLHDLGLEEKLTEQTPPSLAIAWARANASRISRSEIVSELQHVASRSNQSYLINLEIGRLLEKEGDSTQAYERYVAANSAIDVVHRRDLVNARVEQIVSSFHLSSLHRLPRPSLESSSIKPILIVGMPRSGTSLVEQIISAHPAIQAAGESQAIPELVAQLSVMSSKDTANKDLQAKLVKLHQEYIDELRGDHKSDSSTLHITDKNPMNLYLLGHALAFIPDAMIVRVRRDPRDICLSCFSSPLASDHSYKFDLDDCAHAVQNANRVLDHFESELSKDERSTWINIEYEQLTQDPNLQIQQLFDQLDLEPHEDCFQFHKSTRSVQTISRDQVRQPMNTSSVARWEAFQHIQSAREVFEKLENA